MFGPTCATDGCGNRATRGGRYCADCKQWFGLFNSGDEDA
jgi:hypothetical protein